MASALSLSACAPGSQSTRNATGLDAGVASVMGGATGGSSPAAAAAKSNIQKAACGTPTQWTRSQANAVGAVMIANADDPGMQTLAPEWERLDNQVRTCRGEAPRA